MSFNSIYFGLFLTIVFLLYWFVKNKNIKLQNILLLVASYFFYTCWDWRFLFLLMFSTFLDYFSGLKISTANNQNTKKLWFYISISINLGFLAAFKYFNFFAESFANLFANFNVRIDPWTLKIILPVGISFYTFHGLSYVIDIYKNRIAPERNYINYSLFVGFFPLLVAGPIERATHLLPQIQKARIFDLTKAVDGMRQILWGLFKKVVIADQCATYANLIFENYTNETGSSLLLGAFFFSIQIYGDFSGYTDIAIGTAKLFGIDLLRNFSFPYFSRNIAEFWRRWHISLSTWFRDYVYIPLGGSKVSPVNKIRNIFIIFLLSGFWHGANWTFIVWGALNAIYILPSIIFNTNRNNLNTVAKGRIFPTFVEVLSMSFTFLLTVFAWIFFRSENISQALYFINEIFSMSLFTFPKLFPKMLILLITIFFVVEWIGREEQFAIAKIESIKPIGIRWMLYYLILLVIFNFAGSNEKFIYFQF